MQLTRTHIVLVLLGIMPLAAYCTVSQDTILPVFTKLPLDSTIVCHIDVASAFQDWLSGQASAEADNGEATVVPTLSQASALDSLQSVLSSGCSNTGSVPIGFFAIDSCGNQSDEVPIATFNIIDNTPPSFVPEATDIEISCTNSSKESLQEWLDTKAGAELADNCSTDLIWTNYTWEDDLGNTGFSAFEDTTNIVILRESCLWSVNVTFFAQDECGNNNATTAVFNIIADNEPPQILFTPSDTTILCAELQQLGEPVIVDGCDGPMELTRTDSTTQSLDTLSCAFYNYEIYKTWSTIDVCGNDTTTTQIVTVVDTLSPEIIFEQTVAVNCDVDLSLASNFISITDNCSTVSYSFRDSILFASACQNQIIRSWTASDLCGNMDSVNQTIQIQDFTGPVFPVIPKDTLIVCESANPQAIFSAWVNSNGGAIVTDDCNNFSIKGLPPKVYTDTLEIQMTASPELVLQECKNTFGATSTQQVSFVAYDLCGNITQREALFTIIDNENPLVSDCPPNFEIKLTDDDCNAESILTLPTFTDNCLTKDDADWKVYINEVLQISQAQQATIVNLEIGENLLDYIITDCGGNSASCEQTILVTDNSPPTLICPEDNTIYLSRNKCEVEYLAEEIISFEDNCPASISYSEILPGENEFLEFTFNSVQETFEASDFILDFTEIDFENILFKPQLRINYLLDLGDNSRIEIKDESGMILHTIASSDCNPQSILIDLPETAFSEWADNNIVRFIVTNKSNGVKGTAPCDPDNINGLLGTDNVSYFRLRLSYGDVVINKEITDQQSGVTQALLSEVILGPGEYQLSYHANDSSQNQSSCNTIISVLDTISPRILCDDVTYVIDPLLEDFYPILETDLLFIDDDNCELESLTYFPREITCNDQNSLVNYTITGVDIYGNNSSCQSNIKVEAAALDPSFLSGLCFADTLKLLSNIPINLGFRLEWQGPNNFSSTTQDPILTGISGDSSGDYILKATSPEGCVFEGIINIDVSEFDSPEIFSNLTVICNGEELLLNTNSFTETVDYLWYEGVSPNGTLIGQTTGPSFTLRPTTGDHFYYVEVKGSGCNSNPSNTLAIQVTPPPSAEIQNPFTTLCEGDELVLSPTTINPDFTYTWSGPNNFQHVGPTPPPITNITINNQGNYFLVINQEDCVSNTAAAQVVILPNPIRPTIEGESIFCEGQSAVLTVPNVTSGTKYLWYLDGVLFSSVTSNSLIIPSINNSQSGNWTVVVEDIPCSSQPSEVFQVNVESSLNIGATNDGPHCEGDEVLLTCSFIPGASYKWTDPNGDTYNGRIVTAPAIEGLYTVIVTTASNCQANTNTTLSVGKRPTITALSNTSLPCMSGDMSIKLVPTVFPAGNYEYQWTGPNNFSSNLEEPIIANASEANNGIYTLRVLESNCESEPSTTIIDITNQPATPLLSGNQDPCMDDEITIFISNPVQGNTTAWIWTTPTGIVETTIPQLTIPSFSAVDNGNYSVVQQKNGCRSISSESLVFTLQSEPIQPIIEVSDNLCAGETLTLSISEENADQYIWFTPTGTIFLNEPKYVIQDLNTSDLGSYSVYFLEGNCTSDTSEAYFLEVLSPPESVTIEMSEIEICSQNTEELIVCIEQSNTDFEKIVLADLNTNVTLQESDTDCLDLSFLLGTDANYNLLLYAENNSCRSNLADTINIFVYDIPSSAAEVSADTIYVCDQDFISLEADILPSGVDILWSSSNPNVNFFDNQNKVVSISNLEIGVNEILLRSSNGTCINYSTDTVHIIVLLEPVPEDDNYDLAYEENITLAPLLNDKYRGKVVYKNIGEPENGSIVMDGTNLNFIPPLGYIGSENITYEICYVACPDLCASALINLTIGENVNCFVGNVITPNEDGYNDRLTIPCLETGNYPLNSLIVFNQWGDEIFANSPYNNDWAGEHNGKNLPASTYFYILDLGDGSKPIQGYIVLEY